MEGGRESERDKGREKEKPAGRRGRGQVRGGPRRAAAAKDSGWAAERAPLEALRGPDAGELLLQVRHGLQLAASPAAAARLVTVSSCFR